MTGPDPAEVDDWRRRRGIVRIPAEDIVALVDLPDTVHVIAVRADWPTDAVDLLITDGRLAPVDPGAEAPRVDLADLGGRLRLPPAPPDVDPHLIDRLEAAELIIGDIYQQARETNPHSITGTPIEHALADVRRTIADARLALTPPETP